MITKGLGVGEGDAVISATSAATRGVSFSMEAAGTTNGLGNYLVVEGTATIDPTGGRELLAELAKTYLGPDDSRTDFPPQMPEGTPELVIRISPAKIRGTGPWS